MFLKLYFLIYFFSLGCLMIFDDWKLYNCSTFFDPMESFNVLITITNMALSKNWTRTRKWDWEKTDPLKSGPVGKTRPRCLKMFPFVWCHMINNVEVIHFHIKLRGVQRLAFVQITLGKCTTNSYFENGKIGIKTTVANF